MGAPSASVQGEPPAQHVLEKEREDSEMEREALFAFWPKLYDTLRFSFSETKLYNA